MFVLKPKHILVKVCFRYSSSFYEGKANTGSIPVGGGDRYLVRLLNLDWLLLISVLKIKHSPPPKKNIATQIEVPSNRPVQTPSRGFRKGTEVYPISCWGLGFWYHLKSFSFQADICVLVAFSPILEWIS